MFSFNFSLLIFNFLGTIDIAQVRHLMTDLFQLVLEFVLDRPCSRRRCMSMKTWCNYATRHTVLLIPVPILCYTIIIMLRHLSIYLSVSSKSDNKKPSKTVS